MFVAGKMNDPDLWKQRYATGKIDGVALGRAVSPSAYPQMLMRGRPDKIHPCIACGNCMSSSFSKVSATCAVNPVGMRPGQYPPDRRGQKKESPRSRRRSRRYGGCSGRPLCAATASL